ncbi:hypothetical protein [Algibacter sp. PT7-4]|uniref:hypothetical protein n=1 Tax=Algibacter ulvanivorans TaxID=3400999 RepID=UPI003AAB807D
MNTIAYLVSKQQFLNQGTPTYTPVNLKYPASGNYSSNVNENWSYNLTTGTGFKITFNNLDIEEGYDFLRIFKDNFNLENEVYEIDGTNHETIYVPGNLRLNFTSDNSVSGEDGDSTQSGFDIDIQEINLIDVYNNANASSYINEVDAIGNYTTNSTVAFTSISNGSGGYKIVLKPDTGISGLLRAYTTFNVEAGKTYEVYIKAYEVSGTGIDFRLVGGLPNTISFTSTQQIYRQKITPSATGEHTLTFFMYGADSTHEAHIEMISVIENN